MSILTTEHPGATRGELMHEVVWWGAGLMDAVSTWISLQGDLNCAMLASRAEHHVIELVFERYAPLTETQRFSDAIAARIPSLNETSWSRIFEIRGSKFGEAFRQKMAEVQQRTRASDPQLASELLTEVERHDLRALAKSVRPSETTALIKGIFSNLPLPIPVNPLSIADAVTTWQANKDRALEFGWLYFLMELERT